MADVYEQNLEQKSTLTTSDFIRVVGSDNVSYKQNMESVRDTLSFIPRYNASTVDYDTLYGDSPSFRTYAIGHLAQHAPASAWFFLASYRAENSYITQIAYGMTTSDIYTRRFQIGTTGTAWVKMPTRAEVDALNSKTNGTIAEHAVWAKTGNTMVVSLDNFPITNTSGRTTVGTLPSGYHPQFMVYASGFASGVVSYVCVDPNGTVYAYRSTAGNVLATVTFPLA